MRQYNGLEKVLGAVCLLALAACAGRAGERADAAAEAPVEAAALETSETSVAEPVAAAPVVVRSDAPLRYVVKKGDTLWSIASRFLNEPWQWPEIWYVNEQLANPHRIYPGDVLTLIWRDGRPQLMPELATDYLSPRVRELPLEAAIPTVPLEAIRDFLRSPRLVDAEALRNAPYLLSFVDPHVIEGAGSLVYVQNLPDQALSSYDAVRVGKKFVDPDSGELLGWEGLPIGRIEIRNPGQPATALIATSHREARAGDRLIEPLDDSFAGDFHPHPPAREVNGRILAVHDGVSQIGQYQVITLNRGQREGIEPGHVLSIQQADRSARDPYSGKRVALPPLYAGTAMVFKVETKVSYALVMKAMREIHVLDRVEKPQAGERL